MSGYVPNPPKGYRYSGVEPVDTHALRWAEYKDLPIKKKPNQTAWGVCSPRAAIFPVA